jgi:hypothetical protein
MIVGGSACLLLTNWSGTTIISVFAGHRGCLIQDAQEFPIIMTESEILSAKEAVEKEVAPWSTRFQHHIQLIRTEPGQYL